MVNLPTVLFVSKSRKFNQVLTKLDAIEIKIFKFQFNLIVEDKKSNFVIKSLKYHDISYNYKNVGGTIWPHN